MNMDPHACAVNGSIHRYADSEQLPRRTSNAVGTSTREIYMLYTSFGTMKRSPRATYYEVAALSYGHMRKLQSRITQPFNPALRRTNTQ